MSDRKVNPFGGINFVIKELQRKGIAPIIDEALGGRVKQAKYSYSDIILFWIYSNLCGADRLEDTVKLKNDLCDIPDFATPSPDRISGILRSLASDKRLYTSKNGIEHEFCLHRNLNRLMLDIVKKLRVINTDTLDYDNVIIETEKCDSRWTYEKTKGYQPGVAFLGKTPVYIEGRNGNSPASYKMNNTLARCLRLLRGKNIKVKKFRSDSAAYQYDVIELMVKNKIDFFIRADTRQHLKEEAYYIYDWEKPSDNSNFELGEMEYSPFGNKSSRVYRAIVKRVIDEDGNYRYYAILTNNTTMSKFEVLHFYNQRGAIERNFDDLKNNFNWKRIPFSFMNENLVFMIIGAISSIIYDYIIKKFSKKVNFVKRTFRLKNFIFHFISVSSEWISGELKLYTQKSYPKIFS